MKTARRPRLADLVELPDTDHMGESILQALISELLRPLLARFLSEHRGVRAFVGADQFFYFDPDDVGRRIAPDVYVLEGLSGTREERVWKCWELEHPPLFALEIVGRDVLKDYEDVPVDYKIVGVRELVIYDPDVTERSRTRVRWQVWRMVKKRGLVPVLRTNADRVWSETLQCWLRVVGEGGDRRVRIGTGEFGDELFATDNERAELERADAQRSRERAEAERADAQRSRERAELERADAQRSRERAELERADAQRARDEAARAQREIEALKRKIEALEAKKKELKKKARK